MEPSVNIIGDFFLGWVCGGLLPFFAGVFLAMKRAMWASVAD